MESAHLSMGVVINYRIAFLTKNQAPPTGLKPHTDTLREFPYLGTPHAKK